MSQLDPKSKESSDILSSIPKSIRPEGLDILKKDVLRKSVDERKEGSELAKKLKDVAPVAAAIIIAILLESFKE